MRARDAIGKMQVCIGVFVFSAYLLIGWVVRRIVKCVSAVVLVCHYRRRDSMFMMPFQPVPVTYQYEFVGGVNDGLVVVFSERFNEIRIPFQPTEVSEDQADFNMKHHGHPFNQDTKFHTYVWRGEMKNGVHIARYTGVESGLKEVRFDG